MLRIQRIGLEGDGVVLALQGHIHADAVELLERECSEAIRSGRRVMLDLGAVEHSGWSGWRRCDAALLADTLEHGGNAQRTTRAKAWPTKGPQGGDA